MPAPIDYGVQIADPTQAFLSAFQAGTSIQDAQFKQQQQVQKAAQQKLIQAGFAKLQSPNATAADYANLSMMLPETQAKAVRESFGMLDSERQKTALDQASRVFSAFKSNKPGIAISLMDQQIDAKRNSGDEAGAKFLETWRDVAKENPQATENYFGFTISQIPGGDKVIESAIKLGGESRAAGLAKPTLDKAVADASAAVADAQKKVLETADTPSRLLAEADYRAAQTALQRAQTAASEGGEARSLTKFGPELRETIAKADKGVADAITAQAAATNAPEKAAADAALTRAQADKAKVEAQFATQIAKADIDKRAADLGLTKAQKDQVLAATKKLGQETAKIVLEIAALENGDVDPAKKFEQEEKLRKEYQGRTKVYGELGSTYSNIELSAKAKTGPGDIALITGFMKMLDPGSVVRETEFATARDTAGLFDRLANQAQKFQSGQLFSLNSNQRQEYVNLAKQYLDAAQKKAVDDKKALGIVVKNYKLNPENVFGQEAPPLPTSATVGGQTYTRPPSFTDAQWRDYLKSQGVNP